MTTMTDIRGLDASEAISLSFAPEITVRAFVLRRPAGNVLVYSRPELDITAFGDIDRAYLNHWHEAWYGTDLPHVPLYVHQADADDVRRHGVTVDQTFDERQTVDGDLELIPTPGHTPGATALLWDTGEHRLLFTGDTLYLRGDDWVAAVLESSDRERYLESLALIRELDFDVLVPWAGSAGGPFLSVVSADERRRRLDEVIERVRGGSDH